MANANTGNLDNSTTSSLQKKGSVVWDVLRTFLEPLASLRLTVVLLVMAVFVTWIATLDQTLIDIWELKKKHFTKFLVEVPFQTFFVPAWFPEKQNVSGAFFIPSGITIIVAMLVNLFAAHLLRFRIQATGVKLGVGLATVALTGLLTWLVVFNGQDSGGFQGKPPIEYKTMWQYLQVALLGLSVAAIAGCFLLSKEQKIERILLGLGGLVGFSLLGVTLYYGDKAFIGDPAMRIMWQLTQSSMCALIGLVGFVLLFKRKAGIVLLHLGIAGLMLNEVYVTVTNEEQVLFAEEGEVVTFAQDVRYTEMAIIDRSQPDVDEIAVIPSDRLQAELKAGSIIEDESLPFKVECVDFFVNSRMVRAQGQENPGDSGIAQAFIAERLPTVTGMVTDDENLAAAYVKLTGHDGKELGTYLLSQLGYRNGFVDTLLVGEKIYHIGIRAKTTYKDYSVQLIDTQRKNYLGTQIPSWFSSDIALTDANGNVTKHQIWMNNPLRYGGETFYQNRYVPPFDGHKERSELQVVKNHGWMIPYVCCMFVVIGLGHQFGQTLLNYVKKYRKDATNDILAAAALISGTPVGVSSKNRKRQQFTERGNELVQELVDSGGGATTRKEPVPQTLMQRIGPWTVAIAVVGLLSLYYGGKLTKSMRPGETKGSEFQLELLGQIPITNGGRMQPLDSFARNTARQLCNRELVPYKNSVNEIESRPAIQWFADSVFGDGKEDKNYHIVRIEDPQVQRALKLPWRKRFRYSLSEIHESDDEIKRILTEAENLPDEQWTVFQKRIREVAIKLQQITSTQVAFGSPNSWNVKDDVYNRLELALQSQQFRDRPLGFPAGDEKSGWLTWSDALNQKWIADLAKEYGVSDLKGVAREMNNRGGILEKPRGEFIRELMHQQMVADGKTTAEIVGIISKNKGDLPQDLYDQLWEKIEPEFEKEWSVRRNRLDETVASQIEKVVGGNADAIKGNPLADLLAQLEPAYRANNAAKFNRTLNDYLEQISVSSPSDLNEPQIWLESVYNRFSPVYVASVLYLFAFILGMMAWMGWSGPFNRAAFCLTCLALLIHVGALVARVAISGRPPVTNLYSSFIFVSAAGVMISLVVEKITRLGVGNVMAGIGGFTGLLAAWSISINDGDTFTVLRAVLDTQFWLSTHVVIISLGYSATLAAGFLGIAYLIGSIATPAFDKQLRKTMINLIYGVICFGLLFSFFGTVLGGLWADDSWGRFWGWDPKENGALMIVLWNAVVLHARWAGIARERGIAALAIIGNVITLWSWEGVNQMGVGLHFYGFSEGRMAYVAIFWMVNIGIVGLAFIPQKYWFSVRAEA